MLPLPIPAMPDPDDPRYHRLAKFRAVGMTDLQVREALEAAAEEAERTIPKLIERGTTGAAITAAQRSIILREIRALLSSLWGDVGAEVRAGIQRAAEYAASGEDILFEYLRERGLDVEDLRRGFVQRAQNGIEALLAKAANGIPLSTRVYRSQALSNGWVEKRVNAGLLLGKSAASIAKDVRDLINPNVAGGVSYAAQRLARTEINNAYKTAQEARYAEEPWSVGITWNLSRSHPRRDVCDVYASQDLHGLGAGTYPFGEVPKAHPNDMCFQTPVQVDEDEFIDKFLAGDYDEYLDEELGMDPEELREPEPANPTTAARPPTVTGADQLSWANAEAWQNNAFDNPNAIDTPLLDFGELGDPRDGSLRYIGTKQGYSGLPVTVTSKEADIELTRGGTEIWRGTQDWKGNSALAARSAREVDNEFRSGAYEPGTGIYGNGYYFSVSQRVAKHFSGKRGVLTRAVLRAGAKVIDYDELLKIVDRLFDDASLDLVLRNNVIADPGRAAAILGYDAIRVVGQQDGAPFVKGEPSAKNSLGHKFSAHVQYVILNRTALLVEEVKE